MTGLRALPPGLNPSRSVLILAVGMEDAMARTLSDNERPRLVCDLEKNLHGPDFSKLNFEHPAPIRHCR